MDDISERDPLLGSHKSSSGPSHSSYQPDIAQSQFGGSSMSDVHIPVILSWQNVNVFVKEKKKKQATMPELPLNTDNGRKQIIKNSKVFLTITNMFFNLKTQKLADPMLFFPCFSQLIDELHVIESVCEVSAFSFKSKKFTCLSL